MGDAIPKAINNIIIETVDEELLNRIYFAINPHFNYKKIKLNNYVGYNDNKLGFVVEDENSNKAIPNFIFSSAQLNIIALSVFLSMALKQDWLNLDTILLDDPIQNMDDINVLAFIDVLRHILDDTDKQIIMSTHDERLFYLMQKKFRMYDPIFYKFVDYGKAEIVK